MMGTYHYRKQVADLGLKSIKCCKQIFSDVANINDKIRPRVRQYELVRTMAKWKAYALLNVNSNCSAQDICCYFGRMIQYCGIS